MKAYHLTIAAAAASLFLAASGPASATPLAPVSSGAVGVEHFDGAIEPVHYRWRRHYRHRPYYHSYYRRSPVISFGFSSYPYYSRYPYSYRYPHYGYRYSAYPYHYGYSPSFSFGFRVP